MSLICLAAYGRLQEKSGAHVAVRLDDHHAPAGWRTDWPDARSPTRSSERGHFAVFYQHDVVSPEGHRAVLLLDTFAGDPDDPVELRADGVV